jgi:hypothetical protein
MESLPLDELYLQWLYGQVAEIRYKTRSRTYWSLFRLLYVKEFAWTILNDDNRVADGKQLREEFLDDEGIVHVDANWMDLSCSFLEMLIGLSRRLAFETDGEARDWFWHLLQTLDLFSYTDNRHIPLDEVDDILDVVIWRRYNQDGQGGLFPLKHPQRDQREVEIWYQLNAYLMEND